MGRVFGKDAVCTSSACVWAADMTIREIIAAALELAEVQILI